MSDQENVKKPGEAAAKETPAKKKKPGLIERSVKWLKELRSETKKIVWPTFHQVVNNTIVVIVMVVVVGIGIWVFDFLLGQGTKLLRGLFT